jgi:hypothetical protein
MLQLGCRGERKLFFKSSSLAMTQEVGYFREKEGNLWQDSSKPISGLSLPVSFASKNCIVHFGDTAHSDVRGIPV